MSDNKFYHETVAKISAGLREMAKQYEDLSPDSKALRRAASWLDNITNPLTPAEMDKWENEFLPRELQVYEDDSSEAEALIRETSTAEYMREDLQMLEEDEGVEDDAHS